MPSFDIVSEINMHELTNAVDQTNREISTRFDFKGTGAEVEQAKNVLTLHADNEFQIKQIMDILRGKLVKRSIDLECLEEGKIEASGSKALQKNTLRQGIDAETAKKVSRLIKDSKLKVQTAIQGEQVRVTGKKRDDLQDVIALLRNAKVGLPLQYINFRD
ncbi:MAG TPA: YajQ family cyclic di-GMP-binding protein [Gammaproteobacteria bacterium]|nr:YajQ family cyclic di-GMP-binding protein [Gammaproteobacteria bacterium]